MSDLGNKEVFSTNLRYYMNKHKKDRNQVCKDLGFKYSTFSDWVNGKKYPRIDKIEMLSNYFGIQKSDLIEDKKEKEPPIKDGSNKKIEAILEIIDDFPEEALDKLQDYIDLLNSKYN